MAALVTAAAAVAGTAATAMYLDAKFALQKDLHMMRLMRTITAGYADAEKKKRLSLYYFFEASANCRPNEECIWSRDGCYTWSQASDRVNQYAQWFLKQGVKPGDLVSFYLHNSPDFILAWIGLWAIGAAPAMINYNLGGKALIHCLKISDADLLLADDDPDFQERIQEVKGTVERELGMRIVNLNSELKSEIRSEKTDRVDDKYREGVKGNWPMVIFYTSGTTGMPKGCPFQIDRGFQVALSRALGSSLVNEGDRWYQCMPLYHGTGGAVAAGAMMTGVTICIGKKFSTSNFWGEVRDSRATLITYVGETARYLLAAPPSPQDKDHCVRCMYGNGLRPDVWFKFTDRFGIAEVAEFFNSSEGVFGLLNLVKGNYLATSVGHHGALIRFATRNTIVPVLIDQETGAIARDPQTGFAYRQPYENGGEIIVAVPNTKAFAGYYNNPEATMKKFAKDVFKKGDLWYRTGDSLRRTDDGRWFFLDRLGDTFRWKGENVSTAEVSEVLGNFPGVIEANVYGVQLPTHDGRAGCAALLIDPNAQAHFDLSGFLKHSRSRLPKYAVPVFLRVVKGMSHIHNNKQNKVPLREEGVDPAKVNNGDQVLWIAEKGKGNTYVEFHKEDWEDLKLGRALL